MASLLDKLPQTIMRTLVTSTQHAEWVELRNAWKRALAEDERLGTAATAHAENLAFNSWADWIEENNLNYTKYDPRGLTDPHEDEAARDWVKTLVRGDQVFMSPRTGRKWTVQQTAPDGSSITLIRRHSRLKFTHRQATGDTLVAMMKANSR